MGKQEIKLEPMYVLFVKTMEILTWIGLILMAIPGIAYISGITGFVEVSSACQNWNQPVSQFWEATKGIKISGYTWFIEDPADLDCLSLVGILVLAFVPVLSIMVAMLKTDRKYRIILGIVAIEFIIAIIRPLLVGVIGH